MADLCQCMTKTTTILLSNQPPTNKNKSKKNGMVWTDLKGVIDSNTIILGEINTSVTSMDRTVQFSHSVISDSLQQPHGQNSQTKLIRKHWP